MLRIRLSASTRHSPRIVRTQSWNRRLHQCSCKSASGIAGSGGFEIQRVDFLRSHVTQEQGRAVGSQPAPRIKRKYHPPEVFQSRYPLEPPIRDAQTGERRIQTRPGIEIEVLAVARPVDSADVRLSQFHPFLAREVEQL